jgi:hypothetical protein
MSRKRDEIRIITTKEERKQWGRYGKPDKVKDIEISIRKHLLTGSVQVEKLAREIYFL